MVQRSPCSSHLLQGWPAAQRPLDEPDIARSCTRKYAGDLRVTQSVHAGEQAAQHGAIFVEHGVIAIFEQARLLHANLFAMDDSAANAAAQHPIDGAVSVIGAAIAVLAKCA